MNCEINLDYIFVKTIVTANYLDWESLKLP